MTPPELPDVVGEDTRVRVRERDPAQVEPCGEGTKVRAVRAAGGVREAAVLEKAFDRGGAHARRIRRAAHAAVPREGLQVRAAPFSAAVPAGVSLTVEPAESPSRAISMSPSASASSHVESRGQWVFHASIASW